MTSAAEPAKACRRYLKPFSLTEGVRLSNATPFGWSATIVRDRRHVPNRSDGKPYRLQGAKSRFTARAWPLDLDLESAHPMFHGLTTGILGGHLGCIRCRFARTLEPLAAGRRPRDRITLRIGDRDHRIIKSRVHMRCARGDVLSFAPAKARRRCRRSSHLSLFRSCRLGGQVYFFLPAIGRAGPLRVRAFV